MAKFFSKPRSSLLCVVGLVYLAPTLDAYRKRQEQLESAIEENSIEKGRAELTMTMIIKQLTDKKGFVAKFIKDKKTR